MVHGIDNFIVKFCEYQKFSRVGKPDGWGDTRQGSLQSHGNQDQSRSIPQEFLDLTCEFKVKDELMNQVNSFIVIRIRKDFNLGWHTWYGFTFEDVMFVTFPHIDENEDFNLKDMYVNEYQITF